MNRIQHLALMASYNRWMNEKIYAASRQLTEDELQKDRGAFFGSIYGTLNHLAVADTLWLKRFAKHPARFQSLRPLDDIAAPQALDAPLFAGFAELATYRELLDRVIVDFAAELTLEQLDGAFEYASTKGVQFRKNFFGVLMHFFNHQTHHRGQTTTLLSQLGIDVGATDLLLLVPDVKE